MKKGIRRLLCVMVIIAMMVSFLPSAVLAGSMEDDFTGKVIILHTNDVHGDVDGYQYIAGLKQAFLDKGAAEVILVDAGDYSQGTTYVSESKGLNAVKLMNKAGYDVVTLGNHEFDYGYDQLKSNMNEADFSVICANVKDSAGETIFPAYADIEAEGVKIRFIGIETPEAQTKANPKLIKGLTFDAGDALVADVNAVAEEADIVIALAHLGVDGESEPNRSTDIWKAMTGVDFVIDGHSHTVMTSGGNGEPIQSTGTAFANIGVVVIDPETKAIADNFLVEIDRKDEDTPSDADVKALADDIMQDIQTKYGAVFAETEVYLDGVKANVRSLETNLGDLVADAMVWSVLTNSELKVDPENVVAVTNGGGIRANLPAAAAPGGTYPMDITMNDVNTVLPFGNTLAVVYVKGSELLEALEASTYCIPETVGGFPQIAGMNITIDSLTPYDKGEQYPDSTYYGPKSIQRVTIDDINGNAFDPDETYAVITNNFCAAGGDTYYAFAAAEEQFDTGLPLDEVLIDYITEELGGVVGNEYKDPQGRISFTVEDKVIVLHTNDVHGQIDGYQYIAGLRDALLAEGAKAVILADAGDYSQGTTYVSESKGLNAIRMMNKAGYDVATLGNHEFDYGYDQLMDNLDEADFAVICANVKDGTDSILPAYADIEAGGVKIRFIGIETPEAQTKANPKLIQGLVFDLGDDLLDDVNDAADCDADVVIALAHLGVDGESDPNRSTDYYPSFEGVDFVIDGHSHTVMTEGPEDEPMQSTGTAFANIGVIVIDPDAGKIVDNCLVPVTATTPSNGAVKNLSDEIMLDIQNKYGQVFAQTEVYLDGVKDNVRSKETNLGDLITDAMLWSVLENSELKVDPEDVVAVTNGGGIRANLPAAAAPDGQYPMDITKNDVNTVLPFGNTLAVVYVKGSELLEALEASTYCTPTSVGGFPQIAGMTINVDVSKEFDQGELYPGSTYNGPNSIRRVSIADINGNEFDPDKTYAVVTNNFCAAGGDTYYAFAAAQEQFDTGLPLDEVLIDYITNELDGVVGEEYAQAAARITFDKINNSDNPKTSYDTNTMCWIFVAVFAAAAVEAIRKRRSLI